MAQNILVIGGSRNIGYFSSLKLLASGATVTFLLRSPSIFEKDSAIQGYVESGKARLIKGDALVQGDVQHAWDEATASGIVDLLLFTVGGTPKFHPLKGFLISPVNLVTQCLMNCLCTMPRTSPEPRIIVISSKGLTPTARAAVPLILKPMYKYLLAVPHKDKVGAERVISHCAGWKWDDEEPGEDVMGTGDWKKREGLPVAGTLKRALVIRGAIFTDGECTAEKEGGKATYRVSEAEIGGWTISRKDMAHFVVDALTRWEEFENKRINIAY